MSQFVTTNCYGSFVLGFFVGLSEQSPLFEIQAIIYSVHITSRVFSFAFDQFTVSETFKQNHLDWVFNRTQR